ncbi:hypothetical protein Tco_1396850 [Tanacetum coccineum]
MACQVRGTSLPSMVCNLYEPLPYASCEKELRVTGYCNASWQTVKDDSHSQSGWVFLLNGGAVTWKSSKQDTVQTPHASSGIFQLVRLRRKLSR